MPCSFKRKWSLFLVRVVKEVDGSLEVEKEAHRIFAVSEIAWDGRIRKRNVSTIRTLNGVDTD